MEPHFNWLRLDQLDETLRPLSVLRGTSTPASGWLRAIRQALGRTTVQQAARAGIAQPTLVVAEMAEKTGSITVRQLRKLADALDCDVYYAVVPRRPLREIVEERARQMARTQVQRVAHSMALESQQSSKAFATRQIEEVAKKLLAGKWSKLWQ